MVLTKLMVSLVFIVSIASVIIAANLQSSFADSGVDTVRVGSGPAGLAFNPSNNDIYVANFNDDTVSVISGTSVVGTIRVGGNPYEFAFNPSNNYMYEADRGLGFDHAVSVISGTSLVDTIPVYGGGGSGYIDSIAFNPSNNDVYQAEQTSSDTVSVISGTSVIGNVTLANLGGIDALAFYPSNNYMYVGAFRYHTVSVISGTSEVGNVTASSDLFCCGSALAFNPSNNYMYEARYVDGTVFVISGTTLVGNVTHACSFPVTSNHGFYSPKTSSELVFNPSNNYMYVLNPSSNTVSVISGTSLVGNVTVGSGPAGLAFNPSNNDIYVANFADNTVSVISGTETTSTTIQQGSAFVQQPTTGVNATITDSSAPDGTNISITSINYGTTQPAGTAGLSIDQVGFYDVKISGITDGTALICISNPNITTQTNIMQYWFNGIWNNANNPTVTGNIICGGIPANALTGTVFVIGKPPDDTDSAVLGSITAPVDPIQVNTQFTASAPFTYDTDDTNTASWNWGDGSTTTGTVTESGGSGSVQNTHTYTRPGVYTITLTVNNSDGTTATTQYNFVVAYDPDGGFVTGSGWINSPQGAYSMNPALTGKATFGFNSKYQQGATVPTGNTEFIFKVANLNFHSTSYDWLVVSGAKAQYKGTGTINGAGSYHFILTTIDGEINGGGGIDKLRMKITDSNGGLVYDNLLNAPDSSDPSTVLGGGDIIIHKS